MFLTCRQVQDLFEEYGLNRPARNSLWRWSKRGTFPAPRQVAPNRIAWDERTARQHLENLPVAASAQTDDAEEVA